MKKALKVVLCVLGAVVALAALGILFLTITEYRPADVEQLEVISEEHDGGAADPVSPQLQAGEELTVLSWNIGYAGLGEDEDFFMDGGTKKTSADRATVEKYLNGISDTLDELLPDLMMLQEVDVDSARTYRIDESGYVIRGNGVHALNYSCPYVPIPWPPIGRVNSGLFTTTRYEIASAERIALPCPFSWPVSTANLKRCLLVSYLPIEGSDKQLVLVNLHLEAYDDGEGKIAQTRQLREFIQSEYEKGNYVIAGGDFNQVFPGSLDVYPNTHPENWEPGILAEDTAPDGWTLAYDMSVPSCRLLNQPYDASDTENTQHYVIDGLIISPNVQLRTVETVDTGFENSDHNPVLVTVVLEK